MWPLLVIAAAIGIALFSDNGKMKIEPTDESDCNDEFLKFDEQLNIPESKKKELERVREGLQTTIRDFWKGNTKAKLKGFYIQGSYPHETIVRNQDDTCDVDVGIYFEGKPEISPITIRNNIADLFLNRTDEKPERRNKCVRIYYASKFHIDLPIYYFDPETKEYFLAVSKTNTWEPSDPKKFTGWFNEQVTTNTQKRRLIKYFKSWANNYSKINGRKMPSGLAFTILVHDNYEEHQREDIAFISTAYSIYKKFKDIDKNEWECKMPVTPEDNVISKLNEDRRTYFLEALEQLINIAEEIFKSETKTDCVENWQNLFGRWFPDEITHLTDN